jgi:cysteine-rich repeat protein
VPTVVFSELSACGSGALEPGEECDDGSPEDGDGCDSNCTASRCGNGVATAGEVCDDGNAIDIDGCTAMCIAARCDDGLVYASVEACDDEANGIPGDGCEASSYVAVNVRACRRELLILVAEIAHAARVARLRCSTRRTTDWARARVSEIAHCGTYD